MKYATAMGSLFFVLALEVVLSANIAPKLKQSDRRAVGLVPFPRVGRSPTYVPAMMVMRAPRVGRSFIPKSDMVLEPELDADIMFESNRGLPLLDMEIEHQVQNEMEDSVKQLQMLQHMGLAAPHFENKLPEPNSRRGLDFSFPWTLFYSHRDSSNSENTRSKRSAEMIF